MWYEIWELILPHLLYLVVLQINLRCLVLQFFCQIVSINQLIAQRPTLSNSRIMDNYSSIQLMSIKEDEVNSSNQQLLQESCQFNFNRYLIFLHHNSIVANITRIRLYVSLILTCIIQSKL